MPAVCRAPALPASRNRRFLLRSAWAAVLATVAWLAVAAPAATAQQIDIGSIGDDAVVSEANAGVFFALFRVVLTPASSEVVTVELSIADGTATAGEDYVAFAPTTLTFNPGSTLIDVPVGILDDAIDEPDETYTLQLSNPANATLGTSSTTGTVLDDDPPTISIGDGSAEEGDVVQVAVTLSNPDASTVTVDLATADGTATTPDDYVGGSATLVFNPGETLQNLFFSTVEDSEVEGDETFFVLLSNASGGVIGDDVGTVTIVDDDPGEPGLSIADARTIEGSGPFAVEIRLSEPAAGVVTVEVSGADGSAVAGVDYPAVPPATLAFDPGTTVLQFSLDTLDDALLEGDETFFLDLSNPVGATLLDPRGEVTILDDEAVLFLDGFESGNTSRWSTVGGP